MQDLNATENNGILLEDRKIMVSFYQSLPRQYRKDGAIVEGDDLVNIISNVSRAEDKYGGWGFRADIPGKSFTSWIDDETHYALERAGYKWVSENAHLGLICGRGKFEGEINGAYSQMREKVLQAAVLRAVEWFPLRDTCVWWELPPESQNLRCSLKDYLARTELQQ